MRSTPSDAHPHDQTGLEWFDMKVGCAHLDRSIKQVVDCADDRGTAREIAQALDVIVSARVRRVTGIRRCRAIVEARGEDRRDILKRRHFDLKWISQNEFRRADRRVIGWVRYHQSWRARSR